MRASGEGVGSVAVEVPVSGDGFWLGDGGFCVETEAKGRLMDGMRATRWR